MTNPRFVGVSRNLALFEARGKSILVNTKSLTASITSEQFDADKSWKPRVVDPVWAEIAVAALQRESTPSNISMHQSIKRSYTVPKRAAASALVASCAEGSRTPTAKHVSSLLCSGEQLSCEDVLWVSRFFETHKEETTDRATWLSWGGNEGERWAQALASRLDYDSVVADAGTFETPGVQDFVEGTESDRTFWAELDQPLGQYATSLYKLTNAGTWQAWGNGDWFDCDAPQQNSRFIELDDECALYLAGALFDAPDTPIDLRTPNPEAWDLAEAAREDIDWTLIDRVIVSAGQAPTGSGNPVTEGYTPQERAQNAEKQVRDANGRFAEVGAKGAVKSSGIGGTIQSADIATKQITVAGDDGKIYQVPAEDFEVGAAPHPKVDPAQVDDSKVDFEGIVAPAKHPDPPRARMSQKGVVLGPVEINQTLDNYSEQITAERQAKSKDFKKLLEEPAPEADSIQAAASTEDSAPSTAEDVPAPTPDPTPEDSDVDPIYLAIVDKEDPRAVMDLVALVPSTATSSDPKTFRRSGGKWVEDTKILQDLRSATPPPTVQLDKNQYMDVLGQVDMENTNPPAEEEDSEQTVTAAGGLDRNRGNAETLRRYWVHGEGALKIRWGTPGDFDRCVRLLSKHLGVRAKGYCQLRHKEATGIYTATHAKLDRGKNLELLPTYPDDSELENPYSVVDPQVGDEIDCPQCGQRLTFDPLDGFQAPDGSVGHDDGSVHSDYYIVTFTPSDEEPDDIFPPEVEDGLTDLPEDDEEEEYALQAAGGLDQNRGNAENLRHYWTVGPGGLKIRWNTNGDWTRCVRLLSKHLGPRAQGYCALRHREMTGMWPGDKKNREMSGPALVAGGDWSYSSDSLLRFPAVLRASADAAAREAAIMRVRGSEYSPIPPSAEDIDSGRSGRAFSIPLVIPEDLATGDGRIFGKGSLGMRTLPLPLLWQLETGEGHDGSVLVGRIDRVERIENGLGNAYGVFDTGPYGQEAQRLVETKMLRWISADLDKFEIDESRSDPDTGKTFISKGRLMGATLVSKPAFQECTIELVPLEENEMPVDAVPSAISASASIANAIPVEPPSVWFDRPLLNGPTPITVTDEGQVFGHIATWDTNHIGMAGSTRPPRSSSNYAYFHTGVVRTAEATDVKVGQLTLAGGHAPIHLDATYAVKHYDDTASAIADVHAGEDSYGIWVAGALRPGTTPEQIRALRASAPSGDWRAINNRLELVAVCQVNVPGFPVPRALAASGGPVMALVAAGTDTLIALRAEQNMADQRAEVLALHDRVLAALKVDEYLTEFKDFSQDKREKLSKEGKALPDGSFPIENAGDLRRAVHAYGRAKSGNKAKVRRHIVKRARALGKTDLIPSDWKEASISDHGLAVRDDYENLIASARAARVAALRERVHPASQEELSARVEELRSRIVK